MISRTALVAAVALVALWPTVARAQPVSAPRVTVDLSFTSVLPGAPTGYRYREWLHAAGDESADPPPLRGMTYSGAPGGRIDTSVARACTASDDELKMQGTSACEPGSHIGAGTTTVFVKGLGHMSGVIDIFNGLSQEVDVAQFGGRVGAVVRDHYTANGYTNVIPTCLAGGQPPSGCPADQVGIVSSDFRTPAVYSGSGRARRSLFTNPPSCPRSGAWYGLFEFRFADGSVDRLVSRHPCTRPVLHVARRGCRVLRARVTGRDLREVARVDFRVDGRRVARDTRAPYRAGARLRPGRHVVRAAVYAYGARVAALRRSVRGC